MQNNTRLCRNTATALIGVFLLAATTLRAADFLRGDANQDGKVTFADVRASVLAQFWGIKLVCLEALDFDDDGQVDISDAIFCVLYVVGTAPSPADPFPTAGPNTGGTDLGCDSYEISEPPGDPGAVLTVGDVVVPGGSTGRGRVRLAYSSTVALSGMYGSLVDNAGILEFIPEPGEEEIDYGRAVVDRSGLMEHISVIAIDGELRFYGLISFIQISTPIGPQEDFTFLEFPICVKPGTPPGEYPLRVKVAEFSGFADGYAINPDSVDGTIRVLEEVTGDTCTIEPSTYVTYALDDATAAPGEEVSIPLRVQSNVNGFFAMYSLRFDHEVLKVLGVSTIFANPNGNPLMIDIFDLEPHGVGGVIMSDRIHVRDPDRPYDFFPSPEEFELVNIHFQVREHAAPGTETRIRFEQGVDLEPRGERRDGFCTIDGSHCDGSDEYGNAFRNQSGSFTPDALGSLVTIDGILKIVGDVTIFRGDANSDNLLDISDAIFILAYVFLGEKEPRCKDAADVNDDGDIDISDAIALLSHLFVQPGGIAAPYPFRGPDPTPDFLGCGSR